MLDVQYTILKCDLHKLLPSDQMTPDMCELRADASWRVITVISQSCIESEINYSVRLTKWAN
jgi:hypothetical protein